jgi:hypothetical protein
MDRDLGTTLRSAWSINGGHHLNRLINPTPRRKSVGQQLQRGRPQAATRGIPLVRSRSEAQSTVRCQCQSGTIAGTALGFSRAGELFRPSGLNPSLANFNGG